jgi:hypothetical protein
MFKDIQRIQKVICSMELAIQLGPDPEIVEKLKKVLTSMQAAREAMLEVYKIASESVRGPRGVPDMKKGVVN